MLTSMCTISVFGFCDSNICTARGVLKRSVGDLTHRRFIHFFLLSTVIRARRRLRETVAGRRMSMNIRFSWSICWYFRLRRTLKSTFALHLHEIDSRQINHAQNPMKTKSRPFRSMFMSRMGDHFILSMH